VHLFGGPAGPRISRWPRGFARSPYGDFALVEGACRWQPLACPGSSPTHWTFQCYNQFSRSVPGLKCLYTNNLAGRAVGCLALARITSAAPRSGLTLANLPP
jgi:hypothetical protein